MEAEDTGWPLRYARTLVRHWNMEPTGSPFMWLQELPQSTRVRLTYAPTVHWDLPGRCTKFTTFVVQTWPRDNGESDGFVMYEILTECGAWCVLVYSNGAHKQYWRINHECPKLQFSGTYMLFNRRREIDGEDLFEGGAYRMTMRAAGEQAEMVLLKWDVDAEVNADDETTQAYSTDRERLSNEDSEVNLETEESMPRYTDEEHFGTNDEDSNDERTNNGPSSYEHTSEGSMQL